MRCIKVLTASASNKCETNLVGVINKMIANDETMGARHTHYPFAIAVIVIVVAVVAPTKSHVLHIYRVFQDYVLMSPARGA